MHYEDKHEKKASNAKANTGVVLGAIGTGLGVLNAGWFGGRGLFGGKGCGDGYRDGYVDGYPYGGGYGRGCCHPCPATCDDIICIEKEIGCLAVNFEKQLGCIALQEQALTYNLALKNQKEICDLSEKESCDVLKLYRHNDKTAFELYKGQRDGDDCLKDEISCLRAEVAAMKAIRPYQDKIIELEIKEARKDAKCDLEREMCKVIKGEVVLPLTPVVSGVQSISCCNQAAAGVTA